jgi:hypothetical protein
MQAWKIITTLEPIDITPDQLLTQAVAARMLNITVEGVRSAMDAGRLPTILLAGKTRRYTWRDAVIEMIQKNESKRIQKV